VPLPGTKLLEGKEDYAKRAVEGYKEAVLRDFAKVRQMAGLNATNAQKALESEKTAKALEKELDKARKLLEAEKSKYNAQNDGLIAMLSKTDEAAGMQFVKMKRDFEARQKQKAIEKAEQEKLKQLKPKPKGPRL
jgi:predicted DsbA family dithiol-disulfide isomerase